MYKYVHLIYCMCNLPDICACIFLSVFSYSHPYEFELEAFNPDDSFISRVTPKKPLPLEKTPFVFVDNEDKLNIMAKYLNSQKEIAIDLEVSPLSPRFFT